MITQTDLFNPVAHARRTDPMTSHQAAASVDELTAKQDAVLRLFKNYKKLSDEQMVQAYSVTDELPTQSESGLRTRRNELVTRGKLKDTGEKSTTAMGRACIVWGLV